MASRLAHRLAKLEAELSGPADITLEQLVLWSMQEEPLDDEIKQRIANSKLGRLIAAVEVKPAPAMPAHPFSLSRVVEESFAGAPVPVPDTPQPGPSKAASLAGQLASELGVGTEEIMKMLRGLDQPESRPGPASAPTTEEPRHAAPMPVHESPRDRFWEKGLVYGSGGDDEFIRPEPGMSLATLMAYRRADGKDWAK
jgi:hypothetical protein